MKSHVDRVHGLSSSNRGQAEPSPNQEGGRAPGFSSWKLHLNLRPSSTLLPPSVQLCEQQVLGSCRGHGSLTGGRGDGGHSRPRRLSKCPRLTQPCREARPLPPSLGLHSVGSACVCDNRAPSPAISTNYSNQLHGGRGEGAALAPTSPVTATEVPIILLAALPLQVERACGRRRQTAFSLSPCPRSPFPSSSGLFPS